VSETIRISCGEVFDIAAVSDLHMRLTRCFENKQSIVFDAGEVERVDAAALQLLAALFRDAASPPEWENLSEALVRSARLVGLIKHLHLPESEFL
jgi:ABC-type transporter Mla MlaB component